MICSDDFRLVCTDLKTFWFNMLAAMGNHRLQFWKIPSAGVFTTSAGNSCWNPRGQKRHKLVLFGWNKYITCEILPDTTFMTDLCCFEFGLRYASLLQTLALNVGPPLLACFLQKHQEISSVHNSIGGANSRSDFFLKFLTLEYWSLLELAQATFGLFFWHGESDSHCFCWLSFVTERLAQRVTVKEC